MNAANLYALGAIALWASLAALGVSLAHVPPFLLTGLGLLVGSLIALPLSRFDWRRWRVPASTLALGVYGLFGFHFLLFIALRHAPPVQANLVNYLWPLGIVVLAPLFLPGVRLAPRHIAAAIGSFAAVSGALSLLCHALLEPTVALSLRDIALIAALGLGPLGGAFFLWDAALKRGDARQIGVLSFLTPLLSTLTLLALRGERPSLSVLLAAAMIVGAAVVATRSKGQVRAR